MSNLTRIALNLIPDAKKSLDWLVEQRGTNNTDTINEAIQLLAFVERAIREDGATLALKHPGGKVREIIML